MSRGLAPVAALVPAAGAGRRFGGMKLVADVRGEPLLQHTLRPLLHAGLTRIVIVTAPGADLAAVPFLADARVTRVVNPDPDRGMFSSIQEGLASIHSAAAVLVLPADMPFVRADTVTTVLRAHATTPDAVIVAVHEGRRGHPIVLPATIGRRLVEWPATTSLRQALDDLGVVRAHVDVDDSGVLRDVDVPADLT